MYSQYTAVASACTACSIFTNLPPLQDYALHGLRLLLLACPTIPPEAGRYLFNHLIGIVMQYCLHHNTEFQRLIATILDMLQLLSTSVQGLCRPITASNSLSLYIEPYTFYICVRVHTCMYLCTVHLYVRTFVHVYSVEYVYLCVGCLHRKTEIPVAFSLI